MRARERSPEWDAERRRATSRDGSQIAYEVVGKGPKTILLANGLGGRLYAWQPMLDAFSRTHRLITWDYRGLFDSHMEAAGRKLSVSHHVDDAVAILDAEGVDRAVLVGWSMGVQVSLDLSATHPSRVAGLVLINGTYGHVLQTGFQPFFAVPALPKSLHAIIELLHAHPGITTTLAKMVRLTEVPTALLMSITAGRQALALRPILRRYFDDVLGPSFDNYLRLFQELDAHSVYHLLPYIEAPTLVVSGKLDILTPAFQSRQIARRMPRAEHLALTRASHFALLERPEVVVPAIRDFLERRAAF